MSEEIEVLKLVIERLESAGIDYMITGSIALALYATPRMTRDIDIVVQISVKEVNVVIDLFQDDFYIMRESVKEAVQNEGMFNIIHNDSLVKIDLIVRKSSEYRKEEFARRQTTNIDGLKINVVSPEDLILSKLVWAKPSESELQYRDVRIMLRSCNNLNFEYLKKWARELGVDDLLTKLLSEM